MQYTVTPDLIQLKKNAAQAATLLKLMSNKNRLIILCALQDAELPVAALNHLVPLSQSALSQHLAALRKADLVSTRRESQTIYYQVKGQATKCIIDTLKNIFCPDSEGSV